MADVPIPEEELMILFDLVDSIELDDSAPEDLQNKLAKAIQVRNSYGPAEQQTVPDPSMAAPA
jgi:UDP-2,3-diacylglucosamine pyrophosphatase LpxH